MAGLDLAPIEAAIMARKGRPRGEWVDFQCWHAGDDRSASFNRVDGNWFCRVPGCGLRGSRYDIAERVGVKLPESPNGSAWVEETYTYAGGCRKVRLRLRPGSEKTKSFYWEHQDDRGRWAKDRDGRDPGLYRAADLDTAPDGAIIFLCNGEKAVDALRRRGLTATCGPDGEGKWNPANNEKFRDKLVVALVDNDQAGEDHLQLLQRNLQPIAKAIAPLRLDGIPPKGDVYDWFADGHDENELVAMAESAIVAVSQEQPPAQPRYTIHTGTEIFGEIPEVEYVVEPYLMRPSTNLWVGDPGSLKTWLGYHLGLTVSAGHQAWVGHPATPGTVHLVDLEMGNPWVVRRLRQLADGEGIARPPRFTWTSMDQFNLREPADVAALDSILTDQKPSLLLIDALADIALGGDENSVKDMQPVLLNLRSLSVRHNLAVVVIHHNSKAGGYRGTTAILGAVDTMMEIEADPAGSDPDVRTVRFKVVKGRHMRATGFAVNVRFGILKVEVERADSRKPHAAQRMGKGERYVMRYLQGQPGQRAPLKEIAANADSCSSRTARDGVYKLADQGMLRRCDGGRQGAEAEYEIVPQENDQGEIPF